MAVPKKKTSKSKSRKSHWHRKAASVSQKSFSLAMSILSRNSASFVYNKSIDDFDS
uniref:Large ribosomal subunit protein bL32c n=1 Tax=Laurencia verruciformis TaxID=3073068 RepID=A0AA51NF90_9FLOR|nr:50S ribosomal protein L32 [Laurencia obtusa]WMP12175.1 50S ribosomal protein L32 [Laurencia verruciformis]WMP12818.1 50S ribosomal protein L32 [Laurencia obtusa]